MDEGAAGIWQRADSESGPGPADESSGPRALLLRIVESGIPDSIVDPESVRRARIILTFCLVLIVVGLEAVAYLIWSLPPQLSIPVVGGIGVALLLTLLVPSVLRRGSSLEVGANLVVGGYFIAIFACFMVIGGIRAPILHWLALPPVLAVLMGSRHSAWAWGSLGLATIALLALFDAYDAHVPDALHVANLHGPGLWLQRLVDAGSWLAILFSLALVYESKQRQQTRELAAKNDLLETEIDQRARAEERTRYLAYYDELTSLPNRRLFERHLQAAVEQARRIDRIVAVLFLDLDGFKQVNDTLGHELGDGLLQQVAKRLRSCVRVSDVTARPQSDDPRVVSRLGGDEFTVLLTCIRDQHEAGMVADRILRCLEAPFLLGDNEVYISASIGIALYPHGDREGDEDLDDLLRNADLAMYQAKDRGKNTFQFFDESMNWEIARQTGLAADLRRGLERGEFYLKYHPLVDARTGAVTGLEALARWHHPEQGAISTREFIDIAEKSGLIVPLGDWIFREAVGQYAEWRAAGIAPARIAVNVSGPQLRRGTFLENALATMRDFEMEPSCLEIEVTEGAMLVDEDEALRCLAELKDLGVRVALDDFGTGFSSLSYVKRFPVDSLKIDRSFVRNIETDTEAQAISTAIIAMAHRLSLEVVAEGVETREQEAFLREHHCDRLQGFLFGRPTDAERTTRRLQQDRDRRG